MGLLSKAADDLNVTVSGLRPSGDTAAIQTFIEDFQQNAPSFHCLILAAPEGNGGGVEAAGTMLARFGAVRALPGGNCLALIPGDVDRELIAHRFSLSMNVSVLFQISAESAAEAVQAISPYL